VYHDSILYLFGLRSQCRQTLNKQLFLL